MRLGKRLSLGPRHSQAETSLYSFFATREQRIDKQLSVAELLKKFLTGGTVTTHPQDHTEWMIVRAREAEDHRENDRNESIYVRGAYPSVHSRRIIATRA